MATIVTKPRADSMSSKPCAGCDQVLDKELYSGSQWKKGAAKKCSKYFYFSINFNTNFKQQTYIFFYFFFPCFSF